AWEKAVGVLPGIKSLTFEGLSSGPTGAAIEIWLQGHQMGEIRAAADDLMGRLEKFKGVYQIHSDLAQGKNEIRLALKPEARTLGLTVEDLARQVHAGYYGKEAVRLQRGRNDIRVRVRYQADERRRLSDLDKIRIRTPRGHEVPLLSVADVSFSQGFTAITRTDGMRRVAVLAEVDSQQANTNEIVGELTGSHLPELMHAYPTVHVAFQGENKNVRESMGSLKIGFPMAVLGIFIVVATMFRSYLQPFIILVTLPFGIIGAFYGHLILNCDLSMLSMFGMVALVGVVVNDAIVLIERINENLAEGMPFFPAVINGGARRFRAIFLTTISTIGGLAPLIMETSLHAQFLIPMAISLAAGVAFATVLTLVLIPSLLTIMNDVRRTVYRLKHGVWIQREQIEPARLRRLGRLDAQDSPKTVSQGPFIHISKEYN
ncbi:MAG: efflux RND transporter permease subunit, partial [Desulfatitalea sp.]|nr:efflux RND transporter permease subunit [Desulfatitalea sp.]NNK01006.1 efflux RND transporter permease subunit [Desulfatitalea sp.]